jgi:hypothetical protein
VGLAVGRFVAIYQNYADAAVLSGGSYEALLPLENLKDSDIGTVARTIDARPASSALVADLGSSPVVGGVAIGPANLSIGSTFRVTGSNFANFASPVYESGVQTVPGPASYLDWPSSVWVAAILPTSQSARYWRIKVSDPSNPAGYIQFGRLLIGRAFRPSVNYEYGAEFSCEPIYRRVTSLSGAQWDWDLNRRRGLRVNFGVLAESELFGDVHQMRQICGASEHIFVIPDPDDTENFQKRNFLATLRSPPPIVQANFEIGTTVIDCEEVL